jgi:hypothetical protein
METYSASRSPGGARTARWNSSARMPFAMGRRPLPGRPASRRPGRVPARPSGGSSVRSDLRFRWDAGGAG